MISHAYSPFKDILKDHRFESDKDIKALSGAIVPEAAQVVLCGENPLTAASTGCLPQSPYRQFLCPLHLNNHHNTVAM